MSWVQTACTNVLRVLQAQQDDLFTMNAANFGWTLLGWRILIMLLINLLCRGLGIWHSQRLLFLWLLRAFRQWLDFLLRSRLGQWLHHSWAHYCLAERIVWLRYSKVSWLTHNLGLHVLLILSFNGQLDLRRGYLLRRGTTLLGSVDVNLKLLQQVVLVLRRCRNSKVFVLFVHVLKGDMLASRRMRSCWNWVHVYRLAYAGRLLLLSKAIVLILTGLGVVLGVVDIVWIGIAVGMLLLVGAAVGLHLGISEDNY